MKKRYKLTVIPPVKEGYKAPIGSGRISRLAYVIPYTPKKKKDFSGLTKNKPVVTPMFQNTNKKGISFKNNAVKQVFMHWNHLGFPFVKHRMVSSKTTVQAVDRLDKAIKKHGKDRVLRAMENIHWLFSSDWFKYRVYFSKRRLSIPSFFKYSERDYEKISKLGTDCPKSWFIAALRKSKTRLKNKYHYIEKDKWPNLTKKMVAVWKEYKNKDKIDSGEYNKLIKFVVKVEKFGSDNNLDPFMIIEALKAAMIMRKSFPTVNSGALLSDWFWEEILPKELVKYGLIQNEDEVS